MRGSPSASTTAIRTFSSIAATPTGASTRSTRRLRTRGRDEAATEISRALYRARQRARNAGRLRCGIADFDAAIKLNPKDLEAYLNRGTAQAQKGDLAGAVATFDTILRQWPDDVPVYANRGFTRFAAGIPGAAADLEQPRKGRRPIPTCRCGVICHAPASARRTPRSSNAASNQSTGPPGRVQCLTSFWVRTSRTRSRGRGRGRCRRTRRPRLRGGILSWRVRFARGRREDALGLLGRRVTNVQRASPSAQPRAARPRAWQSDRSVRDHRGATCWKAPEVCCFAIDTGHQSAQRHLAQIRTPGPPRIVQQVASRQYDTAHLDHIGALCECRAPRHILLNQQHSNASFRQGRDSLENIRGNKRSQTKRRLVEQQEARPRHQVRVQSPTSAVVHPTTLPPAADDIGRGGARPRIEPRVARRNKLVVQDGGTKPQCYPRVVRPAKRRPIDNRIVVDPALIHEGGLWRGRKSGSITVLEHAPSPSGSPAPPAKLLQFATNTVKMRAEADGCSSSSAENPDEMKRCA